MSQNTLSPEQKFEPHIEVPCAQRAIAISEIIDSHHDDPRVQLAITQYCSERTKEGLPQGPLLDRDDEFELFSTIKNGAINHIVGSDSEQNSIDVTIAYQKLVMSNLRLVFSVSSRTNADSGIPHESAFQEGVIGLMNAVRLFDINTSYKFSTYAVVGIQRQISKAKSKEAGAGRVPQEIMQNFFSAKKHLSTLRGILSRDPTIEEAAETFGVKKEVFEERLSDPTQFRYLQDSVGGNPENGNDYTLGEVTPSLHASFEDHPSVAKIDNRSIIDSLIASSDLSIREKAFISARYGIYMPELADEIIDGKIPYKNFVDIGNPQSLEVIGRMLGVTKERARQIGRKALKKMATIASENA